MPRFLKMPPQVVRLVLLTIAIVGSYFAARHFLVPDSFGEYGHYRGAALQEIREREPFWAGRNACSPCHDEIVQKLAKAEHQGLSCESCHGPSQKHLEDPDGVKLPKMSPDRCDRCHEASPSRPGWFHQITAATHYTGDECTGCHDPHQPKP
jgi:hypothetical protein